MIIRLLLCTVFTVLAASGCNLIYKQNIQQGNAIEQDDLDELYEGMNRRQVLFVLGTPSIMDPFHQDRWDYVQTFSRRGGDIVQRTVTLRFEDDQLTEIIGRDDADYTLVEGESRGDANEIATFTKPVDAQQEAADKAEEKEVKPEIEPEINAIDAPSSRDLEYEEGMDVLDQTPDDGAMSPDIDG